MAQQTLGEYIAQELRKAMDESYVDTEGRRKDVQKEGAKVNVEGMVGDIGKLAGVLAAVPLLGALLGDVLGPVEEVVKAVDGEGGKLGSAFGAGYIGGYMIYQLLEPVALPLQHEVNNLTQNQIFDPQTAADLAARGLIPIEFARSEAHGGGMDSHHLDFLERAAEKRPGLAEMLQLRNRGIVSDNTIHDALQLEGFNADWRAVLIDLHKQLLSGADLALAVLRGEMDQAVGEAKAQEVGIDPEDFKTLTLNTGEPIGLMELLEAYRRGFIDEARLVHGIRQSRVRNEWIDVVEKLRFEPMTTADAVRGVVEHHLTQAEGQAISDQNGLKPEHFPILVESWGRPLSHEQMGSLYHRGLASRGQVDQALHESDVKDKYTDQAFELDRRLISERLIVTGIHYGAITLQEGAKRLLQLGYDQADVQLLLDTGLAEQKQTRHELTRAQIVTLYEDGVLNKDAAIKHLVALGYSEGDAGYMIQIADIAQHAKEVRAEVQTTRNSYLAGAIDHDKAIAEQVTAGLDRTQAEHNVALWDREKRRAARSLTVAQIAKAAKEGVLGYDNALALLEAAGYSKGDAATILYSQGVFVGTQAIIPPGSQPPPPPTTP